MASSAWSIRKHLLVLVAAVALPLAIFSVAVLVAFHNQQRATAEERLVNRAHALSLDVDRELQAIIRVLQVLATSSTLRQGNLEQFQEEAARAVSAYAGWDVISMTDSSGAMVMNTRIPFGSPLPRPSIPKFVDDVFAFARPQVSDLFTGTIVKQPLLAAAVPIMNNGRVSYALALGISPAFLTDILLQKNLPAGWLAAVLDRNQTIIARNRDPDKFLGKTGGPAFVVKSKEGGGGYFRDTTRDGIPIAAAYHRSKMTGWTAGIAVPLAQLEAPLNRVLAIFAGGGAVLVVMGTALALRFGKRVTVAAQELARAVAVIGEGSAPRVPPLPVVEANVIARSLEDAAAKRIEAERALRENEARIRNVFEQASDGIYLLSGENRYLDVNRHGCELLGYTRDELLKMSVADVLAPRERSRLSVEPAEMLAGKPHLAEWVHLRKDGTTFPAEVSARRLDDRTYIAIVRDLTARKRAEEALRESEEKLRLFVQHAPSAIAMFDHNMRYLAFSRRWLEDYDLRDQEIRGHSHYDIFPDLPERWKEVHRRCLAGAIEKAEEDPFPRADGSIDWVRWGIHPWRTHDGDIGGIIIFSEVITERKQAQDALRENAKHLRELSRRLIEVEENERRAISRELHDRIGQNLSAINLNLGMVRSQLPKRSPRALIARFDDARKLVEATSQDVRDVMADLRPAALDDYGLLAALRTYCQPISRRLGNPVSVQGRDLGPRLPTATEVALFRIAQEALTNVSKHARARKVEVTLAATPQGVSLIVADDGVGFHPKILDGSRQHWGMTTMRERAEAIGADLRIESAPGKGTRVAVEVARDAA